MPPNPHRRVALAAVLFAATGVASACGGSPAASSATSSPTPIASGTGSPTPSPTASAAGTPFALRVMGANLSSGSGQNWNGGEGRRIVAGVHPDVVMLQEWNVGANSDAEITAFVGSALGPGFSWARESGAQIPNGIASRWPILSSGNWTDPKVTNRSFEWARIDIPGPTDLVAVSVHLLTSNASDRAAEAQALLTHLQSDVPAGSYLAVAGDFNTDARTETAVVTLSAALSTAGPFPADLSGNTNTSAPRTRPYDWVLVSPALEAQKVATRFASHDFADGLVADTRVYDPIGDLSPALAGDSGVSGMQHMGVVRDFEVTP